jgi:alpha-glucosidase
VPTAWWKSAVVYQIYPRSFQDSDGDGNGDLKGILRRLDYLAELGVDALWLSPIYPSPMKDGGYDITDFTGVDPRFGTMADFDRLVAACHERHMKVLLDFVPNHTSDLHPWFKARRDWFVWRDKPNNWLSRFGGSAWTLDGTTGQYYYHMYLPEQPDLNWRNPEVEKAMLDVIRFWLRRGVDGLRVDSPLTLLEDPAFRDNPPNPDYWPGKPAFEKHLPVYTRDIDENHSLLARMRRVFDEFPGRVFIAETNLKTERLVTYYGKSEPEAHLPFNFQLIFTPWNRDAIAMLVEKYEAALPPGAWPNWVLGNHDRSRVATRIGPKHARLAAMLLLTLRGTPTLYNGEELGMRDVAIPPERVQDKGEGRDPERTPMPWDSSRNAGFTKGKPWLPLGDYRKQNAAAEAKDPHSMLSLYRRLLELRRKEPALSLGSWKLEKAERDVLAYRRGEFLVLLNFSAEERVFPLKRAKFVLSTTLESRPEVVGSVRLAPNEGVILKGVFASREDR